MRAVILIASALLLCTGSASAQVGPPCCTLPDPIVQPPCCGEKEDNPFTPPFRVEGQTDDQVTTLPPVNQVGPDSPSQSADRTFPSDQRGQTERPKIGLAPLSQASHEVPSGLDLVRKAHRLIWEIEQRPSNEPLGEMLPWLQNSLNTLSSNDLRALQTLLTVGCVNVRDNQAVCPARFEIARLEVDSAVVQRQEAEDRAEDRMVLVFSGLMSIAGIVVGAAAAFGSVYLNHILEGRRAAVSTR